MTAPRIHAYVLAADPTWIASTVRRWYPLVDCIVVAYDRNGLGWTGAPVPVAECLEALRRLDADKKIDELPGDFSAHTDDPLENDTRQRQVALDAAGVGADWVLQLDTDELLPRPEALLPFLRRADDLGIGAVEWPMRVLFRRRSADYLQVAAADGATRFEYPGPIAVKPGTVLRESRRAEGAFMRVVVAGDDRSLQLTRAAEISELRVTGLSESDAVLHNSWARPAKSVASKTRSWGHNAGRRSQSYYWLTWRPSRWTWRLQRDLHPFSAGLWPRLIPYSLDPDLLHPSDAP